MRRLLHLENILFLFLFAMATYIAFFCFGTHPDFWFDEGIFYQVTKNWAFHGALGVELSPGTFSHFSLISVGYSVFYPAVLAFRMFGESVIVIRSVAIGFLLSCVVSFYLLSRRVHGPRTALLSLLLFVTFSPLYGNGKSFLGEVPGVFFLFLAVYLLVILEQRIARLQSVKPWTTYTLAAIAGVVFGFAIVAKPLFILILPALAVGILFRWRLFFTSGAGRYALIAGFLGLATAVALWFLTQFTDGTSAGRIFSHYANPYYLDAFLPTIFGNLVRFFTQSTPLLFLFQFALAMYYIIHRLQRRKAISAGEITLLLFAALVGAAYLRTAGWYRYFFPGHLVLFFFTAAGIGAVVRDALIFVRHSKKLPLHSIFLHERQLQMLVVCALALIQVFPLSKNAVSCTIDAATMALPYVRGLDAEKPVLFYSLPQVAALYDGHAGYQYIRMSDALQLGGEHARRLREDFFHTIFIEAGVAEKGDVIPACFMLEETVGPIRIYTRDTHMSCIQ